MVRTMEMYEVTHLEASEAPYRYTMTLLLSGLGPLLSGSRCAIRDVGAEGFA